MAPCSKRECEGEETEEERERRRRVSLLYEVSGALVRIGLGASSATALLIERGRQASDYHKG